MSRLKIIGAGFLNYAWNEWISHVPIHVVRKGFLRLFNRRISSSSVILLHVRILNFWSLQIGDRCVINQYALLDCRRHKVVLHHDVDIGPYTQIWTLGHDPDSVTHEVAGGDVVIFDHVWVASNVTILPNVTLNRGCVVASSSVVTRDVPPLEIWGGAPAKYLRDRKNPLTYSLNYIPCFD
jgi:maltose O-acetyltransferase